MSEEFVEHLKNPSAWLRILFMAGFVIALYVSGMILIVLMLGQIAFSLFTGSDNPNLRRLGASLSAYVAEILAFLTYNTEQKPFPFMPFPVVEHPAVYETETPVAQSPVDSADLDINAEPHSDSPTAATKRSTRRKKPAATDEQETDV
ncbi:MAG: DUF4389 domain-containing protein [Pseudohongiella sp.]|nr:DUF4389 domain-containing protein [Pseudohongiella sp.]